MLNLKLLLPDFNWIKRLQHYGVSGDISAGVTGAMLAFPQAVALAALAGMPPVYGIYASIIPLAIAALWGSSWQAIGGTNTAMAMLLMAAVSVIAMPGTDQYIAIVLVLTFVTGIFQLIIGLFGLGRILDFISSTVITTITMAVAISIMVAVLPSALGSSVEPSGTVFRRLLQFPAVFGGINAVTLVLSGATLAIGLFARKYFPKFSFIIAVAVGTALYWIARLLLDQPEPDAMKMLESVSFDLFSFAIPDLSLLPRDENSVLHLLISALSLALLGMTQAVVIARSLALSSGQRVDVDKEITGQGMANLGASLFSGFAVSSSFSSSATNQVSGANTPLSAIIISLLVFSIGWLAADYLSLVPVAVISAGLMLIALSMFKPRDFLTFRHPRHEFLIFLVTLIASLGFGLIAGIMSGVVLSALVYLWLTSQPKIQVEEQIASDGRPIHLVTIEGSLFFGAVQRVESVLRQWTHRDGAASTLLVRTDHLSYLDVPGIRLLIEEAERRIKAGGDFYLYVERDTIYQQLENSRLLPLIGKEHIIRPDTAHPMKRILFPYQEGDSGNLLTSREDPVFAALSYPFEPCSNENVKNTLLRHLHVNRVFSSLSHEQLNELVCSAMLHQAIKGDVLVDEVQPLQKIMILIQGELSLAKSSEEQSLQFNRKIIAGKPDSIITPPVSALTGANLTTQTNKTSLTPSTVLKIEATQTAYYLLISAEQLDGILGWSPMSTDKKMASVLDFVAADILNEIQKRLVKKTVRRNQLVVRQGTAADAFYIIYQGEAEVVRHNIMAGTRQVIACLTEGDSFGEEALLQGISRNADVRMSSDGKVGVLSKKDFNELLRPVMAPGIQFNEAKKLTDSGVARWLDCRFEPEYSNGILTDAIRMPLNQARQRAHMLDVDLSYIAYCNNGRRSQAVTFLLRERGLKVLFLDGGLLAYKADEIKLDE
jgi:SulP family sulfate permease